MLLGLAFSGWLLGIYGGQAATNEVIPYSVQVWQTDDGLPHSSVHAVAQTGDGYIWVGTHEGLARFDGVRFTLFDEKISPELKHGWITALCLAKDGSLWVACDGTGVARMDGSKISWISEANGLPSNHPRCLLEGKDGSIWIGSDGGLSRWKDGKLTSFTEKNGLGDNLVWAICDDDSGNIRVATRRGLSSMNREGFLSTINVASGMVANALKCVGIDKEGRIWAGSNEGLTCLDGDKRTPYSLNDGLPNKFTTALYKDRHGELWVGTFNGLAHVIDKKIVSHPLFGEMPGERINCFFQDREDNLWVGTWDGLCRLSPARFTTISRRDGLNQNNVMSVLEDRSGTVWIGTWGGGLNEVRPDKTLSYGSANGLSPEDYVLGLCQARDGSLWAGMEYEGGLSHVLDGKRNMLPKQPALNGVAIRAIHQDRKGTLWLGTSHGVRILNGNRVAVYTTGNGLAGNLVFALCEDKQGRMWFGTDGGVSCWTGSGFTNLTVKDGLSFSTVNALYEDKDGVLWIGTRGGGLNRLKDGKVTVYTTKQGLFSDEIYEVLEDDFGFLWMSCRKGIFRVNRREFEDFDRGDVQAISCVTYGRADGLISVQCNGVAKPSGSKGSNGRLWFPTIAGAVAVDTRIKTNLRPPPVVIEEVIADQHLLRPATTSGEDFGTLIVPPGRGDLEIHYTALSFQAPEKNRFKYMLEGTDREWLEGDATRSVRYHNLAPNRYRFRVIASNNDGVWNQVGGMVTLILEPHFWQTLWFKVAIGAAIAGMATVLYRARVKRLREIANLRVQIAADLHDDVGSRLTKVAMLTEHLDGQTTDGEKNKFLVKNISRTTREIIQSMDEIVWTINPKNDTLDNLANYIFQYAQDYFQNSGVRCRMDLPARFPDHPMSTQQRHNLFMAVKEALNNVLKHAQANEVRISLAVVDDQLTIVIADNGRGFILGPTLSPGDGLANMKARLERIGGKLVVENNPGGGALIKLEAPGK